MWIKKNEKLRSHSNRLYVGAESSLKRNKDSLASNNSFEDANIASFLKCNTSNTSHRPLRFQFVLKDIEFEMALFREIVEGVFAGDYYPVGMVFRYSDLKKYIIKHSSFGSSAFTQKYSIVPIPCHDTTYKNTFGAGLAPDTFFETDLFVYAVNPSMCIKVPKGTAIGTLSEFLAPEAFGLGGMFYRSVYEWFGDGTTPYANATEDLFVIPLVYAGGFSYSELTEVPILMDFAYLFFDVSMRDGIINSADVIKINEI